MKASISRLKFISHINYNQRKHYSMFCTQGSDITFVIYFYDGKCHFSVANTRNWQLSQFRWCLVYYQYWIFFNLNWTGHIEGAIFCRQQYHFLRVTFDCHEIIGLVCEKYWILTEILIFLKCYPIQNKLLKIKYMLI